MKLRILFTDTYQQWVDVEIDGDTPPTKEQLHEMAQAAKSGVSNLYMVEHYQAEREEIAGNMPEIKGMEFMPDDIVNVNNEHVRVEDDAVIMTLTEQGQEGQLLYDEKVQGAEYREEHG